MTAFSEYLALSIRPGWDEQYMNYLNLKLLLEKFASRRSKLSKIESVDQMERFILCKDGSLATNNNSNDFKLVDSNMKHNQVVSRKSRAFHRKMLNIVSGFEREEYCHALDIELDKCTKFYLKQVDIFEKSLYALQDEVTTAYMNKGDNFGEVDEETIMGAFVSKFQELGVELLELHAYVGVNLTTLRQILIRYDGMMRTLDGSPIGQWYILTRNEDYNFGALLIHHELAKLSNDLNIALRLLKQLSKSDTNDDRVENYIHSISTEISDMEAVLMKAEKAVDKASRGKLAMSDNLLYTIRYYFLTGTLMNDLVLQPGFMRTRGEKLREEIRYFVTWRDGNKPIFEGGLGENEYMKNSHHEEKYAIQNVIRGPLVINLISQFFYMMSHYIIEPSSAKYIIELGGNDALAGLLIGMTPWAALISGFVYSVWSNHSFRQPLVFSGFLLMIGSLTYALADKYESIPVALAGRFMTGLGAPCTVNRRYIADSVPSAHRTALSALFVTASAFGMSMGPGTAVLLDFLDFEVNLPLFGEVQVNGMTAPGFLMFILWGFYFIALVRYFKDEERIGLKELAEKENTINYKPPGADSSPSPSKFKREFDDDNLDVFSVMSDEELDEESFMPDDEKKSPTLMNQATIICMIFIFLGKVTLEALNSSDSIITRHRFGWSIKNVGTLGFVNGMLVIPIATGVGFLSQHFPDRSLIVALLSCSMAGILLLLDMTDFGADTSLHDGYNEDAFFAVNPYRFVAGQMISFSSLHAFESVAQSTLSKVVPLALAQGTFNSGFIVTTLATLGRGLGDVFITMMGLISIRILLNLLVIPCLVFMGSCLALSIIYNHKLTV